VNAGALFLGATYLTNDAFDVSVLAFPLDLRVRLGPLDLFAGPEVQLSRSPGAGEDFAAALEAWVLHGGGGASLRLGHFFSEIRYILGLTGTTQERFVVGAVPVVLAGTHRSHMLRLSVGWAWWD
jgi:hypothetical protein